MSCFGFGRGDPPPSIHCADAPSGHEVNSDADQVKTIAAGPGTQAGTLRSGDHGWLGPLPGRPGDQHTPTRLGERVDVIHLEGHRRIVGGGAQFRTFSGEKQNFVPGDRIVDRKDRRHDPHRHGHPTNSSLAEQRSTLPLGQ